MRARKTIRVRFFWRSLLKCLSFRAQQAPCFSLGVGKKPVPRRCTRRNDKMEERVTHPFRVHHMARSWLVSNAVPVCAKPRIFYLSHSEKCSYIESAQRFLGDN